MLGAGKAFLSTLSDEQLVQLLHKKGLHAYTQHTRTNPASLKENLALIRKQGYSFDEEHARSALYCRVFIR